jgi:hypothetical protein
MLCICVMIFGFVARSCWGMGGMLCFGAWFQDYDATCLTQFVYSGLFIAADGEY